jgi:hypothetical protein
VPVPCHDTSVSGVFHHNVAYTRIVRVRHGIVISDLRLRSFENDLRLRGDPACGEGKPRALRCRGLRLRSPDFHPRLGPPAHNGSHGKPRALRCQTGRWAPHGLLRPPVASGGLPTAVGAVCHATAVAGFVATTIVWYTRIVPAA